MRTPAICEFCKEPYVPKARHQKFCSQRCCWLAWHERTRAQRPSRVLVARECLACGQSFTPCRSHARTCSKRCSHRWSQTARPFLPERECEQCGTVFAPRTRDHRFCSRRCSQISNHPPVARNCVACGASFSPGPGPRTPRKRFCEGCRPPDIVVTHWRGCARCKTPSPGRAPGAHCSDECRSWRPPVVEGGPACARKERPTARQFVAGPCPGCGAMLVAGRQGPQQRYCSTLCEKRVNRQIRNDRKRAAAKVGLIYRRQVFERDGWACQLCGEAIDRDAAVPDPLAATLDHIVPLVLGGDHSYANVQAAHFGCNSAKGGRLAEVQIGLPVGCFSPNAASTADRRELSPLAPRALLLRPWAAVTCTWRRLGPSRA